MRMKDIQEKAEILIEAIPYLRKFYNKIIVIKYGGHAMVDDTLKRAFADDILFLKQAGIKPVIVHGGGPEINKLMKMVGKEPKFLAGLRQTDSETIELVEMVLSGKINKEIVVSINSIGGKAIGLSGKDAHSIKAKKYVDSPENGEGHDYGYVGEVESIDPHILDVLVREGYVPVISPIGLGVDGQGYNINADIVAGNIAASIGAQKYVCLTDVPGILRDMDDHDSLISKLSLTEAEELLSSGDMKGGMIPKLESCVTAIKGGVKKAHIIDGRVKHAILVELLTDEGLGTMIYGGDNCE